MQINYLLNILFKMFNTLFTDKRGYAYIMFFGLNFI